MPIKALYQFFRKAIRERYLGGNFFTEDFVRKSNYRLSAGWKRKLRREWMMYANTIPSYLDTFSGKGIVICAGGTTYVTCAWVSVSMLRKKGCKLPIEIWYEGSEMNRSMMQKFEEFGASCRNLGDYVNVELKGFAMKPLAILYSSFKEVLFLDADNNAVKDPAYLFNSTEYLTYGAVFWPDAWTTDRNNAIWQIIGSAEFGSAEQESGQLLINKEKCWKELNLCVYFNIQSRYYYKMLLGDKDTFKFAWLALKSKYYMIPFPMGYCGYIEPSGEYSGMSMVQHDMQGDILFLHRNLIKWAQTRDDEVLWTTIKRIRGAKAQVKFRPRHIKFANTRQDLVDIDGNVEVLPFDRFFNGYERECLDILRKLRRSDFYTEFLLHQYFVQTRPGYKESFRPLSTSESVMSPT